jgi:hypothetical protein
MILKYATYISGKRTHYHKEIQDSTKELDSTGNAKKKKKMTKNKRLLNLCHKTQLTG